MAGARDIFIRWRDLERFQEWIAHHHRHSFRSLQRKDRIRSKKDFRAFKTLGGSQAAGHQCHGRVMQLRTSRYRRDPPCEARQTLSMYLSLVPGAEAWLGKGRAEARGRKTTPVELPAAGIEASFRTWRCP